MKNGILIREASNQDFRTISSVISAAFADQQNIRDGQIVQTLLFSELIKDGHDTVSLIAVDSKIVGHVLVSPVFLEPNNGLTCGQVSPLSVHPDFQSKGIGSSLMSAVIEKSKTLGLDALFLLGDPNYYGRFGFIPSKVRSAYGPSDYFQELVLRNGDLELLDINVNLAPAFTRLGL